MGDSASQLKPPAVRAHTRLGLPLECSWQPTAVKPTVAQAVAGSGFVAWLPSSYPNLVHKHPSIVQAVK
eukprot:1274319-Amphidinium_carterae.2